ncbi:DNA mismatch repair protein MutT [Fervidobacterium islandicum]|uniref:DNA mismatch repair protein MutT n=1 Tax=Fervidobacterium islandicum TaxID=2423 RepID=A0AAI8CNP0_FERIS|nr:DNA mismatch repair protein MutT [Fervidobacterium islandicum]AMW33807.2 DNA mismatch repair protein MutT [Fervidobacterium islandicum]
MGISENNAMKEKVLVVKTEEIERLCKGKTGVVKVPQEEFFSVLKDGFFVEREKAEYDESMRQVIPYIVLKEGDEYIFFRRTANQTEKRLHNLITLGVGGHLNIEDSQDPVECFENGLKRELAEEVDVELKSLRYVGLINEIENPVSRVHVGVLYIADVKYNGVVEKENFVELRSKRLQDYVGEMEGWAKVVALYLEHSQS